MRKTITITVLGYYSIYNLNLLGIR